jgi:hypothetical protein
MEGNNCKSRKKSQNLNVNQHQLHYRADGSPSNPNVVQGMTAQQAICSP